MIFVLCSEVHIVKTIYGFKYFIKGKIFEVCKNAENGKGLMILLIIHVDIKYQKMYEHIKEFNPFSI